VFSDSVGIISNKHEIPISKSETNSKFEILNLLNLVLVWNLMLRASNLISNYGRI